MLCSISTYRARAVFVLLTHFYTSRVNFVLIIMWHVCILKFTLDTVGDDPAGASIVGDSVASSSAICNSVASSNAWPSHFQLDLSESY